MSRLIQSLESRTLFSANFTNDQLQIVADVAAVKVALKSAQVTMAADMKVIAADVKAVTTSANKASNAALLKTLKADETQVLALLRADSAALLASAGLARRIAAEGQSLTLNPINPTVRARLAADSAALQPLVDAAASKLSADLDNIDLKTDVENIVTANPSSTALATDAATAQVNATNALDAFETAAETYQNDIGGLITDLDSIPTVPNLVGTYVGTAKATSGNHVGRIMGLTVQFTGEGDDGSLTGMVTLTNAGQTEVQNLVGTVGSDGSFNAVVGDPSTEGATLTGHVIGTKITGTYAGNGDGGVFSVSRSA